MVKGTRNFNKIVNKVNIIRSVSRYDVKIKIRYDFNERLGIFLKISCKLGIIVR